MAGGRKAALAPIKPMAPLSPGDCMARSTIPQLVAATLALSSLSVAVALQVNGQANAQSDGAKPALTKVYFGVDACRDCHGKDKEIAPEKALYYRGTEISIWDAQDKHKDATAVLLGERSRQMAKLLGYKTPLTKEPKCINCHGVPVENGADVDQESYGTARQREKSGVSCVACHGAYAEWVNEHAGKIIAKKGKSWKDLTPAHKQSDYGLTNLWDPATRAALCCSCHVGDAAQGKMVTHEMYAAGHPPLPGIEIVAFGEAMPRHWRTFSEKIAAQPGFKERFKANQSFDGDREGLEQTRMLTIGAVAAFRAAIRLVAEQAKLTIDEPKEAHQSWPELASFECYACHHDLKKDSWRQKRGYTGKPGRPALRAWPTALLALGLDRLEGSAESEFGRAEFERRLAPLRASLNAQPFGEPDKIKASAVNLDKWCAAALDKLKTKTFDKGSSRQSLEQLLAVSDHRVMDFDSVRQIGWALQALVSDVDPALLKNNKWKTAYAELQTKLELELIKGQKSIVPEFLNQTLNRIANYDPEQVEALFDKFSARA